MPVRCALGCERQGQGVHRFPSKFPELFKAWVHLLGEKLENPDGYLAYKNKRICAKHFTEEDYDRNNRLNASAIPSLHLPVWCTLPQPMINRATPSITQLLLETVCIAGDVRLLSMDSQHLELYELLINAKLDADGETIKLCYVCHSQLQKCLKFTIMARRSEKYLKEVHKSGMMVSAKTVHNMLNLGKQQTLSVFNQKQISLDGAVKGKKTKPTPKNNELYLISTKEVGKEELFKVVTDEIKELLQVVTNEKEELIKNETPAKELIENETKELSMKIETPREESTEIETETMKETIIKGIKKIHTQNKLVKKKTTAEELIKNELTTVELVKDEIKTEEFINTKQVLDNEITDESMNYEITENDSMDTQELVYFETDEDVKDNIVINAMETTPELIYFETDEDVKDYVVINDTELYYECDVCNNIFKTRDELAAHQPTHTVEKKPIYKLEDILKETPQTKAPYCPICKKFFAGYDSQLQEHLRIHTGERPYICDLCGKSSRTKHHLKEHIRTHTKEKVYCKICDKGYTQMSSLGKHMLTHTGESPYCCHVCGKSFKQNGQMKAHIRFIHDGLRPYGCDICGKRFPAKSEWRRHMDGHIGKKIFICDQCGVKFSTNAAMVRHKKNYCKRVHKVVRKPAKCESDSRTMGSVP